jgi:hypothetical protein
MTRVPLADHLRSLPFRHVRRALYPLADPETLKETFNR